MSWVGFGGYNYRTGLGKGLGLGFDFTRFKVWSLEFKRSAEGVRFRARCFGALVFWRVGSSCRLTMKLWGFSVGALFAARFSGPG